MSDNVSINRCETNGLTYPSTRTVHVPYAGWSDNSNSISRKFPVKCSHRTSTCTHTLKLQITRELNTQQHVLYIHVRVSLAVRHVTKLRYTPALGCCEFHHLTAVPVASCIHTSIEPKAGSRLGRTGITRKRTINRNRNLQL